VIFVICWFVGWLCIDFAIDKLPAKTRKELLEKVKLRDIRFGFAYVLIIVSAFGIFEVFPTILGFKVAAVGAFFIFIVSVGYGTLMIIRKLSLPRDVFGSILIGFLLIAVGYVVFVFMIRDTLAIRIWY
jgi:hypothetical protein